MRNLCEAVRRSDHDEVKRDAQRIYQAANQAAGKAPKPAEGQRDEGLEGERRAQGGDGEGLWADDGRDQPGDRTGEDEGPQPDGTDVDAA